MFRNSRAHPWHGVDLGDHAPAIVTAYIEIVPTDWAKFEIDKPSGILKVDRPQKYANYVPALYGFLPQTYCADAVAGWGLCPEPKGDGDPIDICVLSSCRVNHGDILVEAIPLGGLRVVDKGEADDKLVAVLKGDDLFGSYQDISEVPERLLAKLQHYFLTYKDMPGEERKIEIKAIYGREKAHEVIRLSQADYRNLVSQTPSAQ